MRRTIPIAVAGRGAAPLPAAIPLSVYIHFPWCVRKCPYCDFNSHAVRGAIPEAEYLEALVADLEAALPAIWGRRIGSVFIGGGTPSLLGERVLDTLLSALRARLPLAGDCEITLEANPGTAEAERFRAYRAAGVNRLSLGIQSFDDRQLRALGRIHDGKEARRAAALAGEVFERFNLDLMYALPGQQPDDLQRDLATALSFGPTHLSAYQLTIEPNTAFAATPPELPDADATADLHEQVEASLAAAGFVQYETSAYAREGHRCRHNLNYWQFGDYLGIGAGAHGKLTTPEGVWREVRWKSPADYLARRGAEAVRERRRLSAEDLRFEYLMNALRMNDGFRITDFERATGQAWSSVEASAFAAVDDSLLRIDGGGVAPTLRGRRMLNRLLERFLP